MAAYYASKKVQLYLNHGTAWVPVAPVSGDAGNAGKFIVCEPDGVGNWKSVIDLGVAANAGKPVVADASGNMSWGAFPPEPNYALAEASNNPKIFKTFTATKYPAKWFKCEGMVQLTAKGGASIYLAFEGVDHPWNSGNVDDYQMMLVYAGGAGGNTPGSASRLDKAHAVQTGGDGSIGGVMMLNQTSYYIKALTPVKFNIIMSRFDQYLFIGWDMYYRSDNDTPMTITGTCQMHTSAATNKITGAGIRFWDAVNYNAMNVNGRANIYWE